MTAQDKTEMIFNFSVALGQPQMEQAAKIWSINFHKVSTAHLKFDYSPNDYDLDSFAWETLTVSSFKLES